ncbi:unnamed protein product [Pylaiella littoralis]
MPNLRIAKLYSAEQIRNSPSRTDGVSEALENDYRRKTCLFLKAAGRELELPIDAVATALVFFHKFFMLHSFKRHERLFVGSACLFLAAKVEESSKRVEQVMSKCWKVWHGGRDPPAENEKAFKRLREKILIAERCVLHTLGFQLTVEHPYCGVMSLLKKLFTLGRGADGGKGADKALNRQLSQAATCFVNDSLVTTVCIQYRPSQVAAAVVYLSYLYMGLPRVDTTLLETELTVVADICDTILSLYDERGAGHAKAVVSDIRDMLKQRMTNQVSAGATISPRPPPLATPPPRPTPSPRPSAPPSLQAMAEPASSSSPSLPRTPGNTNTTSNVGESVGVGVGVGVGSDGSYARRDPARPVEEGRRHDDRDRQRSPSREEGADKSSVKRKSSEEGTDLQASGEEGARGGGAGVGSVDTKRHKPSSLS